MEDREPQVSQRIRSLLDTARDGKLSPADFAYVRAGFFPDGANALQAELGRLGSVNGLTLMDRRELGDDRVYVYRVSFANGPRDLQVTFAPDKRVAGFSIRRSP
jgi:hypothetical protein